MYEYCTSISGGYTKEEFDKFVNEMCQYAKEELTNKNLSISDEDMRKISGGAQLKNKAISSILAAITISTPLVGAASNNQENADIPVESKTSTTQKIKDFVSKNPKKTGIAAIGIPIMVILGIMLYSKNKHNKSTTPREVQPVVNQTTEAEKREAEKQAAEKRAAEKQAAEKRAAGIQTSDQITLTISGVISQSSALLSELQIRLNNLPKNDAQLTEQNVRDAETALQALENQLHSATREMTTCQGTIKGITTQNIKDNVQTTWTDADNHLKQMHADAIDASNRIKAERAKLEKNLQTKKQNREVSTLFGKQ